MLREAKLIAAREGTTLKALVEEGLRHVIDERGAAEDAGSDCSDGTFTADGGGVPGSRHPNDWMSIKHLVRGAGA